MLSESKFYHVIRIKILPCNPFQKSYHVIRVESNRTVSHLVAVSANRKVDPQAERKKLYFIFIRSYLFEDFFIVSQNYLVTMTPDMTQSTFPYAACPINPLSISIWGISWTGISSSMQPINWDREWRQIVNKYQSSKQYQLTWESPILPNSPPLPVQRGVNFPAVQPSHENLKR